MLIFPQTYPNDTLIKKSLFFPFFSDTFVISLVLKLGRGLFLEFIVLLPSFMSYLIPSWALILSRAYPLTYPFTVFICVCVVCMCDSLQIFRLSNIIEHSSQDFHIERWIITVWKLSCTIFIYRTFQTSKGVITPLVSHLTLNFLVNYFTDDILEKSVIHICLWSKMNKWEWGWGSEKYTLSWE